MPVAICFAILAHQDRDSLADLLQNLDHFCPNSMPIIYDASGQEGFGGDLPALVYPKGKRLRYGYGARFILDVMEWSLAEKIEFDFFVVLDSDVLFIQHGYEDFLERQLGASEYIGVRFRHEIHPDSKSPAEYMWCNWRRWRGLLGADHPCYAFNPAQAFRRSLVERIVEHDKLGRIRRALDATPRKAMAEAIYPTLAYALDGDPKSYPPSYSFAVGYRPGSSVSVYEVIRFAHTPDAHIVHPVKPLDVDHPVRLWVRWNAGYGFM